MQKYAVLALIDKNELTIHLLNIKAPVQEAMKKTSKSVLILNKFHYLC